MPVAEATTVRKHPDGRIEVSDGPYAENDEQPGGYYIIEAESMQEAVEWGRRGRWLVGSNEAREIWQQAGRAVGRERRRLSGEAPQAQQNCPRSPAALARSELPLAADAATLLIEPGRPVAAGLHRRIDVLLRRDAGIDDGVGLAASGGEDAIEQEAVGAGGVLH